MKHCLLSVFWLTILSATVSTAPKTAMAEPVCHVPQSKHDRILFSICGMVGDNSFQIQGKDCILPATKRNIKAAVLFTDFIERCGDKSAAGQSYRGIALIYGAMVPMARCVGVDMNIDGMIAEAKAKEAVRVVLQATKGTACPQKPSDIEQFFMQQISYFRRAATDQAFLAEFIDQLYDEAGITIDLDGNVSEKASPSPVKK